MPPDRKKKKKVSPLWQLRLLAGEGEVQADATRRPPVRRTPVKPSVRPLPERPGNTTTRVFRDNEREERRLQVESPQAIRTRENRELARRQPEALLERGVYEGSETVPEGFGADLSNLAPYANPDVRAPSSIGALVAADATRRPVFSEREKPSPDPLGPLSSSGIRRDEKLLLGATTGAGLPQDLRKGRSMDGEQQAGEAIRAQRRAADEHHGASAMPAGAERNERLEEAADIRDVATRALRDANIRRETAPTLKKGLRSGMLYGLGEDVSGRAAQERERIIEAGTAATPDEMQRVGMQMGENPAWLGNERNTMGQHAQEFAGYAIGAIPSVMAGGALMAKLGPQMAATMAASRAVDAGAKPGIARLVAAQTSAKAAEKYGRRATLGQRMAREAKEYQVPGGITEANVAHYEGRDPIQAAAIGTAAGGAFGAAFPPAGALAKAGLTKADMALGRSGVLQTGKVTRRRNLDQQRAANQSRQGPFGNLRKTEEAVQERLANPEVLATPAVRYKGRIYRGQAGSGHNSAIGELQKDLGGGNRVTGARRLMAELRLAQDRGLDEDSVLEQGFLTTENDFVVRGRPGEVDAGLEGAEADRMRQLIDNDPVLRQQVLEEDQARAMFMRDFDESLDAETLPVDESDRLRFLAETNNSTFAPEKLPPDFEEIPWITSEHFLDQAEARTGNKPPGPLSPGRIERDAVKYHRRPRGVPITPGVVDAPVPSGARDALDSLRELAGEAGRDISETLAKTADSPVLKALAPAASATRAAASRGLDDLNKRTFQGVRAYNKNVKPLLNKPGVKEALYATAAGGIGATAAEDEESGLGAAAFAGALGTRRGMVKPKSAPTFYSRVLRNAIEPQGKKWEQPRPAEDWLNHLKRGGNWSQEELRWTIGPAIEQAARDGRKLTKQDVLDLYEENKLEVEVKTLSESEPTLADADGPYAPADATHYGDDAGTVEAGGEEYREFLIHVRGKNVPGGQAAYHDTHFMGDAPENTVAHLRTKTRTGENGEKILAIEELQAQPSQDARKYGVRGSEEHTAALNAAKKELADVEKRLESRRRMAVMRGKNNPAAERRKLLELGNRAEELAQKVQQLRTKSVPDLPYLNNADATALIWKTAIDIAAREGHQKIVWTTGDQQVMRYNRQLRKAADRLEYNPATKVLRAFNDGEEIDVPGMKDDSGKPKPISPERLADYIGDPAAKKLLTSRLIRKRDGAVHALKENTYIEAAGMKNYYDETVPKIVQKYARSLGIELEVAGHKLPDAATEYPAEGSPPEFGKWSYKDEYTDSAYETTFDPRPIDEDMLDEVEYRLNEELYGDEYTGGDNSKDILQVGLKVIRRLRSGESLEKIWKGLKPADRTRLKDAFSIAGVDSRVAMETKVPVNQGFDVGDDLVQAVMNGQAMMANPFFSPKLLKAALSTRAGKSAALMGGGYAVQDIGEELDDDRLEWTGNGIMGLAAIHALGMPRIRAAGKAVGGAAVDALKDVEFGRLKSGKLVTGRDILNAISYDILADPELKKVVAEAENMVAKYDARAAEYGAMLQSLGRDRQITLPNGKKVTLHGGEVADRFVSDIIEGENWEWLAKQLTPEERGNAAVAALLVKNEFEELGRAAVDLGFFAQGTLDAHNRRYLKRLYPDHLADEAGDTGKGARPIAKKRIEKEHHRDDLPQHVRARMGQVRESSFRTRYRLAEQGRQVAMAKLMGALVAMPDVVHPEYKDILEDITRTASALQGLPKTRANRKARGDLLRELAHFESELEKLKRLSAAGEQKGDLGNYRTLPEGRGLGPMAGLVVRKDVYDYLQGMPNFFKGSKFAKALQFWKKAHTIWNPGTHFANAVSNLTVIHMKGLPISEFLNLASDSPTSIRGAIRELRTYGPLTRALTEAGVLNKNVASVSGTEDRIILAPESKMEALRQLAEGTTPTTKRKLADRNILPHGPEYHKTTVGKAISGTKKALTPIDRKLQKLYNAEDNVYRVALLAKATTPANKGGMGMTMEEGIEFTRHHMGDFRTRSPLLVGTGMVASPFIMYPAKMLPHMMASVVEHPERWITIAAFFGAADQLGQLATGEEMSEADLPPDKRTSSTFGYLIPGPIQMPYKNEKRRATYAVDWGRFTPFSALSGSPAPGALVGNLADRVPPILAPSGPAFDIGARLLNKDPYTGDEWIDYAGDSPLQKTGKVAQAVAGMTMPSAVSFHAPRIAGDVRDRAYGRAGNDALGLVGLRPREVKQRGFDESMEWERDEAKQRAKKKRARALKRTSHPGRRREIMQDYRETIQRIDAHFDGKLGRRRQRGSPGSNVVDLTVP